LGKNPLSKDDTQKVKERLKAMNKKANIIKLPVKTKAEEGVIEEGNLGELNYKLFNRNNIQITDGYNLFRKDCSVFIEELLKHHYSNMHEGQAIEILGAGDTDSFIITKVGNNVVFKLGETLPSALIKLMEILEKA
jgi:hypothetical protein